eukprot:29596-Pelagococcus_subviridis.AAC.3
MILRGEAVRELVQLRALHLQPAASEIELVHVLLLALPRQLRGLAVAHEPRALLLLVLLLAAAVAAVAAVAAIAAVAVRARARARRDAPRVAEHPAVAEEDVPRDVVDERVCER